MILAKQLDFTEKKNMFSSNDKYKMMITKAN